MVKSALSTTSFDKARGEQNELEHREAMSKDGGECGSDDAINSREGGGVARHCARP
jgi:hypothetical protein